MLNLQKFALQKFAKCRILISSDLWFTGSPLCIPTSSLGIPRSRDKATCICEVPFLLIWQLTAIHVKVFDFIGNVQHSAQIVSSLEPLSMETQRSLLRTATRTWMLGPASGGFATDHGERRARRLRAIQPTTKLTREVLATL